jgi:hypothetical protein
MQSQGSCQVEENRIVVEDGMMVWIPALTNVGTHGHWTTVENTKLTDALRINADKDWNVFALVGPGRTIRIVYGCRIDVI